MAAFAWLASYVRNRTERECFPCAEGFLLRNKTFASAAKRLQLSRGWRLALCSKTALAAPAKLKQAMGSSGAIELADLEGKMAFVELRCELCERFGRYNVAALIERFGRNESVLNVRTGLTTGCPKQRHFDVHDLCQARWSDDMLVALYGEEQARELAQWRRRGGSREETEASRYPSTTSMVTAFIRAKLRTLR